MRKGFTLIEMLIVIAIIGLLASILLIGFGSIRASGRNATRMANIRTMQQALEVYHEQFGTYPQKIVYAPIPDPSFMSWSDFKKELAKAEPTAISLQNDPLAPDRQYSYFPDTTSVPPYQHYMLMSFIEQAPNHDSMHNAGYTGDGQAIRMPACVDPNLYCVYF